jgi:hypothetical protein
MCSPSVSLKISVCGKTDQKVVFLGRKAYISDQLYIMIMYINFYGFKKF